MSEPADPSFHDLVVRCLDRMEVEGPAALAAMCAEHPEHADALRKRVQRLVKMGLLPSSVVAPASVTLPSKVGDFRLLERLGAGGMGVVYEAEQVSLQRRVALKLIRPEHLFFDGARDRFIREINAVARLSHPGIVPVYLAGEDAGLPYFAMERIDGVNLAEALKSLRHLPLSRLTGVDLASAVVRGAPAKESSAHSFARMSWVGAAVHLVRQVGEALAHAHARGVLHRDVKPSNVMLTPDGRAMLLDFGLATTEGATRITRTGSMMGSLPYMSPEQVEGRADEVGEATDVYSLGVTLYEMLTLVPPYQGANTAEVREQILHAAPKSPREVNPAVPWDVETVCLCAMNGDIGQRYPTMAAFVRDLGHILELTPIEARPPTPSQRVRKWVRRHPTRSVAIGLGSILLGPAPALFGWITWKQNQRIEAEAAATEAARRDADDRRLDAERAAAEARESYDSAEATVNFLQRILAAAAPDAEGRGGDVRVALDHAAEEIGGAFAGRPAVEASVRNAIGESYYALGEYDKAGEQFVQSLRLHEAVYGEDDEHVLKSKVRIGKLRGALGHYQEAVDWIAPTCDRLEALCPVDDPSPFVARIDLAYQYVELGLFDEATDQATRARAGLAARLGESHSQTLVAEAALGSILYQRGSFAEAERVFRSLVDKRVDAAGPNDSATLVSMNNLVAALFRQRKLEEAEELAHHVYDADQEVYGPRHATTLKALSLLAAIVGASGQHEDALALQRELLDARRATLGEHPDTFRSLGNVADELIDLQRYDEALPPAEEAYAARCRMLGDGHVDTLASQAQVGTVRMLAGDPAAALPNLEGAVSGARDHLGEDHWLVAMFRVKLGHCYIDLGRLADAERELTAAYERLTKQFGSDDPRTSGAVEEMIRLCEAAGRDEEAAAWRSRLAATP